MNSPTHQRLLQSQKATELLVDHFEESKALEILGALGKCCVKLHEVCEALAPLYAPTARKAGSH